MDGEQGVELQERERGDPKNRKHINKYLPVGSSFRVAEFQVPPRLPSNVIIVGQTDPSGGDHGPSAKPVQEARIQAHITGCGSVTRVQSFLPEVGNSPKPRHMGGWGSSVDLSASQKIFMVRRKPEKTI